MIIKAVSSVKRLTSIEKMKNFMMLSLLRATPR